MSFTESIAAARAFARPASRGRDPNRELLAIGAANAAGGLLGAMPAGGGTSQTAVNRKAGARTQLAGARHRGVRAGDAAAARAADRADAAGGARRGRRRLLARADQAGRVRRHPPRPAHRVPLGARSRSPASCCSARCRASWSRSSSRCSRSRSRPTIRRSTSLGRKRGTDVFRPRTSEHPDDETWPGLLILRPEGRLFFAERASGSATRSRRSSSEAQPARGRARLPRACSTSSTPRSRC